MKSQEPDSTRVRVALPSWLWGGNPEGLLVASGLRSRPSPDGNGHLVQTEEAFLRRTRPGLVTTSALAGPGIPRRFHRLAGRAETVEPTWTEEMQGSLQARKAHAEESGDLLAVLNYLRLASHAVDVSMLPEQTQDIYETLLRSRVTPDDGSRPFENAGVQLIEVNSALYHRLKLASVWQRLDHDPRLAAGDLSHLIGANEQAELAFASSQGLYTGVYMLDAYLGPLLACLTPGVWAVQTQRTFGNLIFTLGRSIAGTLGDAAEPLQWITVPGATEIVPNASLGTESSIDAVGVWASWLDDLFGVVSDLAVFASRSGDYRPEVHLQAVLTLEQVFRRMTSMLISHRDSNARLAMAFTILDSLEALNGVDLIRMCTLSYAKRTLARVEDAVPGEAAQVLLPTARSGVRALEQMQDGFFIVRQLGLASLPAVRGGRPLKIEEGVAQYIKVLRNATHGHGSRQTGNAELTNMLLVHHDGNLPHNLGFLAYLYLVDLLVHPRRLDAVLRAWARRTAA